MIVCRSTYERALAERDAARRAAEEALQLVREAHDLAKARLFQLLQVREERDTAFERSINLMAEVARLTAELGRRPVRASNGRFQRRAA